MPDAIEDRVLEIVARCANVERDALSPSTTLKDLGVSSLDAIEVIFDIEEAFDIRLPDQGADLDADSLAALVAAVREAVAAGAAAK